MLTELCQELRNWFVEERYTGEFEIRSGAITAPFLVQDQYYRIIGSIFNDGVHQFGREAQGELKDERWTGYVWALAIPKEVVQLAGDIKAWRTEYEAAGSSALSPFNSESFGGYTYSKSAGASGNGGNASWKSVFKSRLNMWRKIL